MEKLVQISSGRGPAECCLLVARLLKEFLKEIKSLGGEAEIIDSEKGQENGTLLSAFVRIKNLPENFLNNWEGSILWICKSPYRKYHKRKNWFIGLYSIDINNQNWNNSEISYQTLRASGPGGQHVNKTESAVRAIHKSSGISVLASDSRSQYQNKQLATERLKQKLAAWQNEQLAQQEAENWNNHNSLIRGNPVRVYEGEKFRLKR